MAIVPDYHGYVAKVVEALEKLDDARAVVVDVPSYQDRLHRYLRHVEHAGEAAARQYVRENGHRCMFPMKRGGECALNLGHKGPHTQRAFQCDSCGGYRRGTPHVTNESGAFCYYCVEIWIGKEGF